jgi:hypothetical protein
MQRGRLTVLLSVLLVGLLALTACAPRATGGAAASRAGEAEVVVDLPALVIDVQNDGSLSVGGMSFAELGAMAGQDLSTLSIPPDLVQQMAAVNIQHIQIDNTDEGLLILVNGKPIPTLAWDGQTLVTTSEVLGDLGGAPIALLDKLLPLITNVGLGVILRMPVAEGEAVLPYVDPDDSAAQRAMAAQREFLDAVQMPPTFQLVVAYAPDGSWEVGGISQDVWAGLAPALGGALDQFGAALQGMSGVDEISLDTNANGFFISINGKQLPYISWKEGRINNVLDLAMQSGLLEGIVPDGLIQQIEMLLPAVMASNVSLKIDLP